ncbi:unnamed protein product [Mytilus edulis]|uniref:Uncharacterized protein n=1 Tax=Mytilus edulis TaxID=6550 RepID=A0A8S3UBW9_MYTED|nr:unnamed protein product [Mytilus edulis]
MKIHSINVHKMNGNETEASVQYFRRERRRSSITWNDYVRIKASLKQMKDQRRTGPSRYLSFESNWRIFPNERSKEDCYRIMFWIIFERHYNMNGNETDSSVQYFRRDRRRSSITFNDYVRIKASLKQMRGQRRQRPVRQMPLEIEEKTKIDVSTESIQDNGIVFWIILVILITVLCLLYIYS